MGIGLRIYFLDDTDSLRRLPVARYERLMNRVPGEAIPQYAGNRIRCAMVSLEVEDRKPKSIIRIDYPIIPFDTEGRLDSSVLMEEMRLVTEFAFPALSILDEEDNPKIVDARDVIAKKRHSQEFTWVQEAEVEKVIVTAIFGKTDTGSGLHLV